MPSPVGDDAHAEGIPRLVTIPQIPDLLEAAGIKRVGPARIRQLASQEGWPAPVFEDGRTRIFDWAAVERYFRSRETRQGLRTDLLPKENAADDTDRPESGDSTA